MKNEKIGFIGQGWIGKHYADDFESRNYPVIRYALEEPYRENRAKLANCSIVFIAVPTPTTEHGFDASAVSDALSVLSTGTIGVIKSTLLPGTTEVLQAQFSDIIVLHSPEFLREVTAAHDAANPLRNIIGIPIDSTLHRETAERVLDVLPKAPYERIMSARAAELVKYAGNGFLYQKVLFMNLLYDLVRASGESYDIVRDALIHDPRIGDSHTQPVHDSGRGAGGHCFIKDFEALRQLHGTNCDNPQAQAWLDTSVTYNNHLLVSTGKNLDLLESIYGATVVENNGSKPVL